MKIKTLFLLGCLALPVTSIVHAEEIEYSSTLVEKAQAGDAQAQYELGEAYYQGYGIEENLAEALKWYRKAAAKDNLEAIYSIGYMYDEGEAVKEDNVEAMKWLLKAAEKGHLLAHIAMVKP